MELSELEIKILVILKNTRNVWKSPSEFSEIFNAKYGSGITDKTYSFNWICMRLRKLNETKLLKKTERHNNGRGRLSLYKLSENGLKKLEEILA